MTAATEAGPRIATLDIVRGIAVMGILAMNIVAFAMPFQAYMNPTRLRHGERRPTSPPGCSASSSSTARCAASSPSCSAPAPCWSSSGRRPPAQSAATVHYCADVLAARLRPDPLLLHLVRRHPRRLRADRAARSSSSATSASRALVNWGIGLVVVQTALFCAVAGGVALSRQRGDAARRRSPKMVQPVAEHAGTASASLAGQPLADKLALFRGP